MPPLLSDSDSEGSNEAQPIVPRTSSTSKSKEDSRTKSRSSKAEGNPIGFVIDESDEGSDKDDEVRPREREEDEDEDGGGRQGDEDEEEEEAEEYIVERIMAHEWHSADKCYKYETKWLGWDDPMDITWEPEENLEGAIETLHEYFESIGGKPEPPKSAKKRGRPGAGVNGGDMKKKARTSPPAAGKRRGPSSAQLNDPAAWGPGAVGDWSPPPPKKDAWEDRLIDIETVEPDLEGNKWAYVRWAEQDNHGRHRKSKEALHIVYKCAPQKMLAFYERHLVFSNPNK